MKISRKTGYIIALSAAIIFIGIGLVQIIFEVEFNKEIVKYIDFSLLIIVGAVLMNNRKQREEANKEEDFAEFNDDAEPNKEKDSFILEDTSNSAEDEKNITVAENEEDITGADNKEDGE